MSAGGQYVTQQNPGAKTLLNTHFSVLSYEADVTPGASGDAGLIFRVSSPGTGLDAYKGYYAGIAAGSDRVILGKASAGTWTELASAAVAIDANVAYHLAVVANGNNLSAYLNHSTVPSLTATDATYASGAVGLRAHDSTASFDNVTASTPPGAIFYANGGFGGLGISLGAGSYTLAQLNAAGIPNDYFTGTMWKFTADTSLVPADANDQMSSVKILAP